MKPLLAILAHESAQPTIDDFLPRWQAVAADLVCYLPEGHNVTGFETVRHVGKSAHSGVNVFQRFADTLRDILTAFPRQSFYIVAEYDTVPLRPVLPRFAPGVFLSHNLKMFPHMKTEGAMQVCSLSPWIMDGATMARIVDCCDRHITEHGECKHIDGLLDRWIGEVLEKNKIPHTLAVDTIGYPWHDGILDRIERTGVSWVHGLKHAHEFRKLWNI